VLLLKWQDSKQLGGLQMCSALPMATLMTTSASVDHWLPIRSSASVLTPVQGT
jgi:hypothetical protein